jgi:hypothetical protein
LLESAIHTRVAQQHQLRSCVACGSELGKKKVACAFS